MLTLFKYPHFVILVVAFVVADLAVALLGRAARKFGAVDLPGLQSYKTQKIAIPFVGGLGVFIGFIAAVLITLDWAALSKFGLPAFMGQKQTQLAAATMIGGSLIALMGLIDDFKPINAVLKLLTLVVITLVLTQFGLTVHTLPWDAVNFALALFWIVGVVSAFNAIDNTDGVAGVTAVTAAFWLFMVAWGTSIETAQPEQTRVAVALGGAVLGFLRHNKPPARVYLGNCGAFTIGFFVAALAISGEWKLGPLKTAVAPLLLLAYPVFDISYTVFLRWRHHVVRSVVQAIVVSGRDHTAHRIRAKGLGPWQTLMLIAGMNCVGGGAVFAIVRFPDSTAVFWVAVGAVVVAYAWFGWWLRDAVDLRSKEAKISHRVPTGPIQKLAAQEASDRASGRFPPIPSISGTSSHVQGTLPDRVTRRVEVNRESSPSSDGRKRD